MELENTHTIIIDNGGDTIKAGSHLDCNPHTLTGGSRELLSLGNP